MNPDQERLAEALAVRRMYGDSAEIHVAERIGALALVGESLRANSLWPRFGHTLTRSLVIRWTSPFI